MCHSTIFGFFFNIFYYIINALLSWYLDKTDLTFLLRTWVLKSCQSVCRTSTKASLNASKPSSKVLLNSYTQEEPTVEKKTKHYTVHNVSALHIFFLCVSVSRLIRSCGKCYGWSREVHDDSSLQGSLLSWDHRWWEKRPGNSEENQVSKKKKVLIMLIYASLGVLYLSAFPPHTGKHNCR